MVMECATASASKSKVFCGFLHDGKRWLTKIETTTYSDSSTTDAGEIVYAMTEEYTSTKTTRITVDDSDPNNVTCSGEEVTYSGTSTRTTSATRTSDGVVESSSSCVSTQNTDGTWMRTITTNSIFDGTTVTTAPFPCVGVAIDPQTVTYEDEFTPESTAELIERTIEALPTDEEFEDMEFGGSPCEAMRNLSPPETSFTISKLKWRLVHFATPTCFLRVWLQRRYELETGEVVEVPIDTPYEWNGSGQPCFDDESKPVWHVDNRIFSDPGLEALLEVDGKLIIQIVKWSFLPSYEPNLAAGDPNGWPPLPVEP